MGEEGLRIDHVILGVKDLEATAKRFREKYKLLAFPGGVHPGGTKNMSVSLESRQYVELLAVDDSEKVRASDLGELWMSMLEKGDFLTGWAIAADGLDAVASRLGIEPSSGSITFPDGGTGSWRYIESNEWDLPFFIEYAPFTPEQHGRVAGPGQGTREGTGTARGQTVEHRLGGSWGRGEENERLAGRS